MPAKIAKYIQQSQLFLFNQLIPMDLANSKRILGALRYPKTSGILRNLKKL